ncbi:MAG: hypothetical protein KatS3mg005_3398 [Bryobacteraceae bacterium]|nr:MAG: hypothetical protein KatS3mg005_3398 [Bryobacteraceae bacterium]
MTAALQQAGLFEGEGRREGPFSASRLPPTKEEILVASLIWQRRGQGNPISIARLRQLTGFSERQIKGIVEQLVVAHRMRIGARREEPAGYFMIETAEDLEAAVKPYRNQILAMWRRLRVLEQTHKLMELLGQLRLED